MILFLIVLVTLFFIWIIYVTYTTKYGAPFVALEPQIVGHVMDLVKLKPGEIFYELGSGDGRLVIAAALRGANVFGIEIDPLRVLYSRVWIFFLRLKNAQIINKNIFDVNLSKADVICMFLLPETNLALEDKLKKELKKGTRVVSVSFEFANWTPVAIDLRGPIYGPIYLYIR